MLRTTSLLLVALFSFAVISPVGAQETQQGPGIVAVLDLAKVFELHPGHKAKMETLQRDADAMKAKFQQQQDALQAKAKQASEQFQGDSLNQAEVELRKQEVELQTTARQAQNELMKKEAEAYYSTYQDVMGHVHAVCKQYNVSLVLRWDGETIDPANPGTVIRGVQRTVVFANADLTKSVLARMGVSDTETPTATAAAPSGNANTRRQ